MSSLEFVLLIIGSCSVSWNLTDFFVKRADKRLIEKMWFKTEIEALNHRCTCLETSLRIHQTTPHPKSKK